MQSRKRTKDLHAPTAMTVGRDPLNIAGGVFRARSGNVSGTDRNGSECSYNYAKI
jgi:hypothetical protein